LIHDREKGWALMNSMPARLMDDGVPRENQAAGTGAKTAPYPDLQVGII
jgi:hypothetical protein